MIKKMILVIALLPIFLSNVCAQEIIRPQVCLAHPAIEITSGNSLNGAIGFLAIFVLVFVLLEVSYIIFIDVMDSIIDFIKRRKNV